MAVSERDAYALGRRIHESASSEDDFWDSTKSLAAHLDVIDMIANNQPLTELSVQNFQYSC
jgi:hypothetical protein